MSSSAPPPSSVLLATTTSEERAQAAAMRSGSGGGGALGELTNNIPFVLIDEDAVQKYAIIAVYRSGSQGDDDNGSARYFVRGSRHASYHKDAARPLVEELRQLQVPFEVVGGGRISHRSQGEIKVYGFSYGFPWKNGQSKHHITAELLRARFPGQPVTYSDEGY
ncbi:hypothetical protein BASA81_000435 [Batrachochytrium salamandrivorans]|nr:hypothetical protein BASA81_000435 [Batrachochytrium salamandrivorans]